MSTHAFSRLRPWAAASLLALAGTAASAATVTFTGTTDSGPLPGAAFSGSFSHADPVDADFSGSIDLDSFTLSFDGLVLTLTDADAPALAWFSAGSFIGVDFFDADSTPWQLSMTAGFTDLAEAFFSYTDARTGSLGFGTPTFTVQQPPAGVPEPATLALMAGALGLLAATRRRAAGH